ncbi:zinc finger protein 346-like isoform X2 [Anticarsia gemmatalis]|uniref:zinc finger protein 346-like isoform X2 n=1 Tax=Anticarsia gemmatalis TaxID=129554 RepID=UPI003F771041
MHYAYEGYDPEGSGDEGVYSRDLDIRDNKHQMDHKMNLYSEPSHNRHDLYERRTSQGKGHWGYFNSAPIFDIKESEATKKEDSHQLQSLIGYGIPREIMKKLPKDFWKQVSLECCCICNLKLKHIQAARAHYLSRQHLKSQSQWLAIYCSVLVKDPSEAIKPRSAYCELCDVDITSETHARSHYSGRTHWAIAVGRRLPKNYSLRSQCMANRLEKLRRRELKYLKIGADKREEPPLKLTNSDLHCIICQTTVNNSEQMTSHLNGKKHLHKEKRHIFNLMQRDCGAKLVPPVVHNFGEYGD